MLKVTRVALWIAGVICALLAVALLAVNLYVQSKGTQARIEQELGERLGATIHIRRISVTPWWGLKLTGITMPQGDASLPDDFLRADIFRLRIRLSWLFGRWLVIKEVSLINPKVVWRQNPDGKWRLPTTFVANEATEPTEPAPGAAPPAETKPVPPPTAPPAITSPTVVGAQTTPSAPFTPEVRRVRLTNGVFRFLDQSGSPVATFEGVRFRSNFRRATELRGDVNIARVSLRDRFHLEHLRSPVSYDPAALEFSDIAAEAAGGEIQGRFSMRPGEPESPFSVMVKFKELDANRLLAEAHGPEGMLRGQLEGQLDATGRTADPNALSGTGEIFLRNGEVRRYSLLVALGQMLQIEELMQLKLDQAHIKFHIAPGVVTIDELLFTSRNIRLSATGTIDFEGQMRLESELGINERVRGQLFSLVRDNFKPTELPGYSAVKFQVTGTVARPKTNLVDKVVGQDLRDLGGVINSLFGHGRADRAKRKKAQELINPSVAPAPSASPAESPAALATPLPSVASPAVIAESPAPAGSP
ncbi:MAG: AsmA-like C-terminal region-containing protein [Chthoniobacterales bacterium]